MSGCRHCGQPLQHLFLDLGSAPPSNAYLSCEQLAEPEMTFPLRVMVCENCWLVQTAIELDCRTFFTKDYAYFSSTSSSWLKHAADYCVMITRRLALGQNSFVVEIASNDGYLLRNFVEDGVPCLGVEPTDSTADAAEKLGVPVLREFFGESLGQRLAHEGQQADLILGNNVFAHVPDINDFTRGMKHLLKPEGTITLEFPHLLNLIHLKQFDTVYHEHYSYLSLHAVSRIFKQAGLRVYDVESLPTHGGSLRVYGCHLESRIKTSHAVETVLQEEVRGGLLCVDTYVAFQSKAEQVKNDLLAFLIEQKRAGKSVAAYGAAAKGNTLLNFAGVKPDLLPYICDAASAKQDKFMPGSHIPIFSPDVIKHRRPDFILVLPWNIVDEVIRNNSEVFDWGGRFVTAVPELRVMH